MIRQAHTYLVGAVSATGLIAAAVVAFVVLVSLQALQDWPLVALGGGSGTDSSSVAPARPIAPGLTPGGSGRGASASGAPGEGARHSSGVRGGGSGSPRVGAAPGGAPVAAAPGGEAALPGGGGGTAGSPTPSPGSGSSGGSASSGGGSGGGTAKAKPSGGGNVTSSPSHTATSTVDDAVSGIDQATGGALGDTGVTKATEEVVDGVAGSESTVGKTVDKTVEKAQETVGGLRGGGH